MSDNNNFQDWFASKIEKNKDDPVYVLEGVLLDLTERIAKEMKKQKVTRSELARKLGKKPSFITRVLRGKDNLTFSTAVQIGLALGLELKVDYKPLESASHSCDDSITELETLMNKTPQSKSKNSILS
jgi:transcriptional regulator with XRE-family HTH domain